MVFSLITTIEAAYPDDAGSKDELIRMADQAMYRVKESTRDSVQSA